MSDYDWEKFEECLVKLVGGVVKVNVGVVIESEMKEKKVCVEDVLYVICVVVEDGIFLGGGVVFLCVFNGVKLVEEFLDDEKIGYNIVICVCCVLFIMIL